MANGKETKTARLCLWFPFLDAVLNRPGFRAFDIPAGSPAGRAEARKGRPNGRPFSCFLGYLDWESTLTLSVSKTAANSARVTVLLGARSDSLPELRPAKRPVDTAHPTADLAQGAT